MQKFPTLSWKEGEDEGQSVFLKQAKPSAAAGSLGDPSSGQ